MFTAPWGAAQLLAMAEDAEEDDLERAPLRTTITAQHYPDYATVVVVAGGISSTTTTTRTTDPLHARHRQLQADLRRGNAALRDSDSDSDPPPRRGRPASGGGGGGGGGGG